MSTPRGNSRCTHPNHSQINPFGCYHCGWWDNGYAIDLASGSNPTGSSLAYFLSDAHSKLNIKSHIRVIEKGNFQFFVANPIDNYYTHASTTLSVGALRQQFSTVENILIGQYGYHFFRNVEKYLSVGDSAPILNWTDGPYLYLASEKGVDVLKQNHAYVTSAFTELKLFLQNANRNWSEGQVDCERSNTYSVSLVEPRRNRTRFCY